MLGGSELVFNKTPDFGKYPSSKSTDTDEEDIPLQYLIQKRMVPTSTKGKENVIEEESKRRPFTRFDSIN